MKYSSALLLLLAAMVSACTSKNLDQHYPKSNEERRQERFGKMTGTGGLLLFGGKKEAEPGKGAIYVNGYLWRASLEVTRFMPLLSTDPFGGTILSDWHSFDTARNERFKLNILVASGALRTDGVKVTVFKQVQKQGQWVDVPADPAVARALEDQILTEARALHIAGKR